MPGDLHTHTTFSDGSTPIARLSEMAARAGLNALAISDHDTTKSILYAQAHPRKDGVELIPAAELSAYDYARRRKVHLLAYWPDLCPELEAHCARLAEKRNAACLQSARELEAIYPQFRAEHALEHAQESGVLFKSGIMQELRELGFTDSLYGPLYKSLFGTNPPGRVHHPVRYDTVDTVLETLRACRAVVVFAHPSVYKSMELVRELAAAGRIDGIEVDHPRNTEADKAECRALCRQYGLIVTGGTDFHGSNTDRPNPVGTGTTADDQIERIRALAAARKQK